MKISKEFFCFLLSFFCVAQIGLAMDSSSAVQTRYEEKHFLTPDKLKDIEQDLATVVKVGKEKGWDQKWGVKNEASLILLSAASTNKIVVVEYMLSKHSKYDIHETLTPSHFGKNALHSAIAQDHPQVIWFLLTSQYAEHFLKPDSNDFTVLHMAAKYNQNNAADLLLSFHPWLAFMDIHRAPNNNDPNVTVKPLIKGRELALAIGALDVVRVKEFIKVTDSFGPGSPELLRNILIHKTGKDTNKVKAIQDVLKTIGTVSSDGPTVAMDAPAIIKLLDEYLVGFSQVDREFEAIKTTLLTAKWLSFEFHEALKNFPDFASSSSNKSLMEISPGLRFHMVDPEACAARIMQMRSAN